MVQTIFCINSGRCGSQYLFNILGSAKNVIAFHEAQPTMSGNEMMNLVNYHDYKFSYNKRKNIKIPIIKQTINKSGKIYAETNHMFIKTFWDVSVDEFGQDIFVIILRRPLSKVLRSFMRLEYFGKNTEALKWMTSPNAKTAAIKAIANDKNLKSIDKCIAYLIDIEARAQRFVKDYPNVKIYSTKVEDLNNVSEVISLFEAIGLEKTVKTNEAIGKIVNQRKRKNDVVTKKSLMECKQKINSYILRAAKMGIKMPEGLLI